MSFQQTINLLVAINKNYMPMCETMLFSFFEHHRECSVNVYILNRTLEKEDIDELTGYIYGLGGKAIVIPVPDNAFMNMPTVADRFSAEIYFRIFAHKFLPSNVEKVLWLDADIVLISNIEEFYNQDFEGKSLIVCRDFGYQSEEVATIKKKMDVKEQHEYFNSGVILFNLNLIREQFKENEFYEIMYKYADKLVYPDQDLLNHIYQDRVRYIDEIKYNYQVNCIYKVDANKLGIKVLHYAGNKKPWNAKYARPISKYYWKYQFKMKKYREFISFYFLYYLLWIPKFFKRMKYPEY